MTTRRIFTLSLCASLCAAAAPARAEDPPTVAWSPDWPRFSTAEGVVTALGFAQMATVLFFYPDPQANWEGGILFDDAVRDALVLETRDERERASLIGDAIYYALVAYPILIDTALVADQVHDAPDVAGEMLAMNLESYAVSGAIALTAERIGRVRPSGEGCKTDPNYTDCDDHAEMNASFLSGHTAAGFAAAGLTCAHHQHLPLYGGGLPDLLACLTTLSAASVSGFLRLSSDNHYSTDVILGAAVGLASGYGLPSLLHYGFTSKPGKPAHTRSFLPTFRSRALGTPLYAVVAPTFDRRSVGLSLTGVY